MAGFDYLRDLQLYERPIEGDGNCLFSALSDQVFGDTSHSAELRASIIHFIRDHRERYLPFIDVTPNGGTRQQPKRKATRAHGSQSTPTPAEVSRAFDHYANEMEKDGTYGGHMEIVAFAACYQVDVFLYQEGIPTSYAILPTGKPQEAKFGAHIAYHASYMHYSSVRNIPGPHEGPPMVKHRADISSTGAKAAIQPWMIQAVENSCPFPVDGESAAQALELNQNDIDGAVTYLLEQDSGDGTPRTDSIESSSSDSEMRDGPQKRQDRRLSRARKERQQMSLHEKLSKLDARSLDSLLRSESSSIRIHSSDGWSGGSSSPPPLDDGSTTPGSSYSPPSEEWPPKPAPSIKLRLTLTPESRQSPAPAGPQKLVLKQKSPHKRLSARDAKPLKKQAQKQARKERQQQQQQVLEQSDTQQTPSSSFGSQSAVTTEFRTMQI